MVYYRFPSVSIRGTTGQRGTKGRFSCPNLIVEIYCKGEEPILVSLSFVFGDIGTVLASHRRLFGSGEVVFIFNSLSYFLNI